jgi:hypothetical protein
MQILSLKERIILKGTNELKTEEPSHPIKGSYYKPYAEGTHTA